jgi:flagellar hook assembly protein FlgD
MYQLYQPAKISFKIYNSTGTLIRTVLSNVVCSSGTYTAVWDGKNSSGAIVSDGAYYFTIEDSYSGTPSIIYNPAGTGGKDISKSIPLTVSDFNAYNNTMCNLSYTLPRAAKVNLKVRCQRYSGAAVKVIKYQETMASGSYTTLWDGRDEIGEIAQYGSYTFALWGYTLDDNSIVVTGGKPEITAASINPLIINPLVNPYRTGSVAKGASVSVGVSMDCNLSINIYTSDGILVRTLANDTVARKGTNTFIWDGTHLKGYRMLPDSCTIIIQARKGTSYSVPISLYSEIGY